ncbi:hypothetical protein BpHYR1_032792 [Brachionus plicatilis]|uniref:Uncharacterized protein n=1 Tax=Brachionus plicatilis TaxID=10195 RepID=A0A3M7SSV0_BRAPC|nr:hypothetical protein BpHYR1_032792 [Brachionus plicatilis]
MKLLIIGKCGPFKPIIYQNPLLFGRKHFKTILLKDPYFNVSLPTNIHPILHLKNVINRHVVQIVQHMSPHFALLYLACYDKCLFHS